LSTGQVADLLTVNLSTGRNFKEGKALLKCEKAKKWHLVIYSRESEVE
jgi:hypothetical protein